ncbi:hypothetical protein GCM10017687_72160 [Streptomyces echinatus]
MTTRSFAGARLKPGGGTSVDLDGAHAGRGRSLVLSVLQVRGGQGVDRGDGLERLCLLAPRILVRDRSYEVTRTTGVAQVRVVAGRADAERFGGAAAATRQTETAEASRAALRCRVGPDRVRRRAAGRNRC